MLTIREIVQHIPEDMSNDSILEIIKNYDKFDTIEDVDVAITAFSHKYEDSETYHVIMHFLGSVTGKQMKTYIDRIDEFNSSQLYSILSGYHDKLSNEEISLFDNPEFSSKQMSIIRNGISAFGDIDTVKLYADTRFSYRQMREIYLAISYRISPKIIKMYANLEFDADQMHEIFAGLYEDKLPYDKVSTYAKPFISQDKMRELRLSLIDRD